MSANNGSLSRYSKQPQPFAVPESAGGGEVQLRPVTFGERSALLAWNRDHKDDPGAGLELVKKVAAVALGVTEEEVDGMAPLFVDAVGEEAARRCGMYAPEAGEKKATPSPTPNSNSPATSPATSGSAV